MPNDGLELRYREIDGQRFPTVEYADSPSPLCVAVFGEIFPWYWGGRSEPRHIKEKKKMEFQNWKVEIAKAVGARRGDTRWSEDRYIISVGFVFGPDGPHDSDVDNHLKPILDATATALFEPNLNRFLESKVHDIQTYHETGEMNSRGRTWGCDDHRFKTVFAHSLPSLTRLKIDPDLTWTREGIAICVSSLPT